MLPAKRFYTAVGLLIFLNVLIKPCWLLVIDRQVQNLTGTAGYGTYFSLYNLCFVFVFLLDWGITVFYNRQSAADPSQYLGKARQFFFIKLMFTAVYVLVILTIAAVSGISNWHLLLLVMAVQVLTSFLLFIRSIVTAQQMFHTDAWLSVSDKTLMILLVGSFLLWPQFLAPIDLFIFLYLQIMALFAVIVAALFLPGIQRNLWKSSGIIQWKDLWKKAFPYAVLVFLMSVHIRLDGFLLERLHPAGAYEAGIYAASYRLLDAANMPGYLLTAFLLPYIARHFTAGRNVAAVVLHIRHLLIFFAAGIFCISLVMAPWLQQVLYHHEVAYSAWVMRLTISSIFGYVLVQLYGTMLTASGDILQFVKIIFISVCINVVLNLCLIPSMGAAGCAISAICSQLMAGIVLCRYASARFQIDLDWRSWLIYLFTIVLLLTILTVGSEWKINKMILMGIAALTALFILWATDLFNLKKWKTVLQ